MSKDLQINKCSTKGWQIVLFFLWLIFRYNISFIDLQLVGFGEIFPSVMVFPSG